MTFTFQPLSSAISQESVSIFKVKAVVLCRGMIQSFRYYLFDNLEDKEHSQVIRRQLFLNVKSNSTHSLLLSQSHLYIN